MARLVSVVLLALLLTACGGETKTPSDEVTPEAQPSSSPQSTVPKECRAVLDKISQDLQVISRWAQAARLNGEDHGAELNRLLGYKDSMGRACTAEVSQAFFPMFTDLAMAQVGYAGCLVDSPACDEAGTRGDLQSAVAEGEAAVIDVTRPPK